LDGIYVEPDVFIVMDIMSYPRLAEYGYRFDPAIQEYSHVRRMEAADAVVGRVNLPSDFHLATLIFREFRSASDMYAKMRMFLAEDIGYPVKGLQFVPENLIYNPTTIKKRLWLTKPSIVFTYQNDGLYNRERLFTGTREHPLNEKYDKLKLPSGTLVEYVWHDSKLTFLRHRYDLSHSDSFTTARIIWEEYIHRPNSQFAQGTTLLERLKVKTLIRLLTEDIVLGKDIILDATRCVDERYLGQLVELRRNNKQVFTMTNKSPSLPMVNDITSSKFSLIVIDDYTDLNILSYLDERGIVAFLLLDSFAVEHTFNPKVGFNLPITSLTLGPNGITLRLEGKDLMLDKERINLKRLDDIILFHLNGTYDYIRYYLYSPMLSPHETKLASLYHYGWLHPSKQIYINEGMYVREVKLNE
jgi:hypothetical protein